MTLTPSSSSTSEDDGTSHIAGPLIAAAIVPSTILILAIAGILLYCSLKRRRLRRMHENSPYSSAGGYSRGAGGAASTFVSEILETFSDEGGKRRSRGVHVEELEMKAPPATSYLSVLSSNLSGSFRSLARHPQDSTVSGLVNPLSAPPPARMGRRGGGGGRPVLSVSVPEGGGSPDLAGLPSPLWARSRDFLGMGTIDEGTSAGGENDESGTGRVYGGIARYNTMGLDGGRIGQAI